MMIFNISCSIFTRASARPLRNPATNHGSGCFVSVLVSLGNRPFARWSTMPSHCSQGNFSFFFILLIFFQCFFATLKLETLGRASHLGNSMTGGELIYGVHTVRNFCLKRKNSKKRIPGRVLRLGQTPLGLLF